MFTFKYCGIELESASAFTSVPTRIEKKEKKKKDKELTLTNFTFSSVKPVIIF